MREGDRIVRTTEKEVWFGLVLRHINYCWLFNAKSGLNSYIRGAFNKLPDFFVQALKLL